MFPSSPSPEDGNKSSFPNVVFFGIQDDGKSGEKFYEFSICNAWEREIFGSYQDFAVSNISLVS
jgi:hypothetical protein